MKITKYPPIGEALTVEAAAVQAAYALDSSASIAESQRDAAGLLAVGDAWMKLADFLAALADAESKNKKKKNKVPLGFQPTVVESDKDDDDETLEDEDDDVRSDDDGADEGSDCSGLHREHGKLRIPPR